MHSDLCCSQKDYERVSIDLPNPNCPSVANTLFFRAKLIDICIHEYVRIHICIQRLNIEKKTYDSRSFAEIPAARTGNPMVHSFLSTVTYT